ncbi:MAG TPA: prepilin-type N-terminal cleavage/methylation domain-containing protein [Acidimicrobiia bacterium]|nr:prepilin-type N-terminal cleavage/methylation domain-containing protein [Acidimicrobiia bacterium]
MRLLKSRSPRTSAADASRRERGTTLVEVMVTLSLLVVVSAALLSSMNSIQKSESYSRGRSTTLDAMRLVTSKMTKEIRQGEIVRAPTDGGRLELVTYINGASRTVTYQVSGTELTRKVDSGTAAVVLEGLVDPSIFSYTPSADFPELVTIHLQVQPPNLPDTVIPLVSNVRLRNIEVTS